MVILVSKMIRVIHSPGDWISGTRQKTASIFLYLFIYLAVPDLSCSIWDLVPWPRIKPQSLNWKHRVLTPGPPGKSWYLFTKNCQASFVPRPFHALVHLNSCMRGRDWDQKVFSLCWPEMTQLVGDGIGIWTWVYTDPQVLALSHPTTFSSRHSSVQPSPPAHKASFWAPLYKQENWGRAHPRKDTQS